MKNFFFLLCSSAAICFAASCTKSGGAADIDLPGEEIAVMNGVGTKGYVDGVTFFEKAVATMHTSNDTTARTMRLSAYRTPEEGQTSAAGNYFVNQEFVKSGKVWRHTPAYYWPLASKLDFLAYSSTTPFPAKDAKWNATNAAKELTLSFDRSRCQDDVLYAAQKMESSSATDDSYVTGQPVNMEFQHSQAWIEFQLSVATAEMKGKIAVKEIVLENAYDSGSLTITNPLDGTSPSAEWTTGVSANLVFDDSYNVYGHSKTVDEYVEENAAVTAKQEALEAAKQTGNTDTITAAEQALAAAKASLDSAVALYPVVNAIDSVGTVNDTTGAASAASETKEDCVYLDMLLPQQPKANIIIRYILAGRPDVLEYKYTLTKNGSNWEMGRKYIYDIDFVVSEITVSPTVKAYQASFDGADLSPVEIK